MSNSVLTDETRFKRVSVCDMKRHLFSRWESQLRVVWEELRWNVAQFEEPEKRIFGFDLRATLGDMGSTDMV